MTSCEYASRMKAGPRAAGAGRPEKRVAARSKPPQKKCTGLALPTNAHCDAVSTRVDLQEDAPAAVRGRRIVRTVHGVLVESDRDRDLHRHRPDLHRQRHRVERRHHLAVEIGDRLRRSGNALRPVRRRESRADGR